MCSTRLICRLPARDSRWRTWSPEEASIGAVPFQEAKCALVGEPGHVTDLDQQPGGAGGTDPVQGGQRGAGGLEQFVQFLVGGLLALVDAFQVADQLGGDPAAGLARGIAGTDPGQQGLGLGRGQVLLRTAGDELQQQLVQLGDHAGVVLAQGPPPVSQDPQHRELLVIDDRAQASHPGGGQRDRVRVGGIGLAALPGGEHPGAGRQLGRHIHDLLTIGQQPVRDVPADALASLDRPASAPATAWPPPASPHTRRRRWHTGPAQQRPHRRP